MVSPRLLIGSVLLLVLIAAPWACSPPPDDDDDDGFGAVNTTSATTSSVTSGSTSTTGAVTTNPFPCVGGQAGDDPSGNSQVCASGMRHRQAKQNCPSSIPRANFNPDPAFLVAGGCLSDADCTMYSNGYCALTRTGYYCDYGCLTDSDCGVGNICDCGPFIGRCVTATCTVDADCGTLLCTAYDAQPGCDVTTFGCQSAQDLCGSDSDCASGSLCSAVGSARRCTPASCSN